MRVFAHIATVVALLLAFVGLPAWLGGVNVSALLPGVDAVSAATAIQDAPSGSYTILINRDLHTNDEVLGHWLDFLAGKDVPLIMEDVSCVALEGDVAGIEMANSLASRLPANQMKVRVENGVLVLSKAEVGRFDIMVMSDETAEAFGASTTYDLPFVEVVHR